MTAGATHSHTQRGIAVIGDDTQSTKGQDPMSDSKPAFTSRSDAP